MAIIVVTPIATAGWKKTLVQNEIFEEDGTDVSNDISQDYKLYYDADRIVADWCWFLLGSCTVIPTAVIPR